MSSHPQLPASEIRLSWRALAALLVLPQAGLTAALLALVLDPHVAHGPGRAAPLAERRQAHADTVTPAEWPAAAPAGPARPAPEHIDLKAFLDRLLAARPDPAPRDAAQPRPFEARDNDEFRFEANEGRLREEIGGALESLDAFALPDSEDMLPGDRLDDVRALLNDLQGLQASFASLRGGQGGLNGAFAQILPLLDALQALRDRDFDRLDYDPALRDALDRYLGRDEERPARLGLLLLLARALEPEASDLWHFR